jgi:hypothetical protein
MGLEAFVENEYAVSTLTTMEQAYVHGVIEREFLAAGTSVLKVGRSEHGIGSMLVFKIAVRADKAAAAEAALLNAMRSRFTARTDVGAEYFQGSSLLDMVPVAFKAITPFVAIVPPPTTPRQDATELTSKFVKPRLAELAGTTVECQELYDAFRTAAGHEKGFPGMGKFVRLVIALFGAKRSGFGFDLVFPASPDPQPGPQPGPQPSMQPSMQPGPQQPDSMLLRFLSLGPADGLRLGFYIIRKPCAYTSLTGLEDTYAAFVGHLFFVGSGTPGCLTHLVRNLEAAGFPVVDGVMLCVSCGNHVPHPDMCCTVRGPYKMCRHGVIGLQLVRVDR